MTVTPAPVTEPTGTTTRQMREEDDRSLREWIDSLCGDSAVRVSIIRKKPDRGPNGEQIGGSLETVEERPDEDYIRETWGGGSFQLKIQKPNGNGNWQYFRARTIKLAGPPKMNGQVLVAGVTGGAPAAVVDAGGDDNDLTKTVLSTMQRTMERAQDEAASSRGGGGFDVAALQALQAPIIAQLEAAQREAGELRRMIMDATSKEAPTDPFRDKLMEKMVDGESVRLESLRARYDSEIRQLKDNHTDEIKRMREYARDDLKQSDRRHERELDNMKATHEGLLRANDVSYSTRTDGLSSNQSRLERELTEARAELVTLRAKKNQTISEKAEEILKVKDALTGLSPGGGDDSEKPWYERALGAIANSSAAQTVVERIAGGEEEEDPQQQQMMLMAQQQQQQQAALMAAQQQQAAAPPVGVPFQAPDGNIYVRNPDDSVTLIDPEQLRRQRAAAVRGRRKGQTAEGTPANGAPEAAAAAAPADPAAGLKKPEPADVAMAVNFMENAIRNGTEPEKFAATARNMVPAPILNYIQAIGVDEFMNKVARLEAGSPLTSQHGRNFAREVVKHLFGGVND